MTLDLEPHKKIKIFTGTANPELAHAITRHLDMTMGDAQVSRFRDGELKLRIGETVRGADVYVIQPTSAPADPNLMELLIMADAFRRASARSVTAVMPYYGYARQDRKNRPRDPISAKLVANLLTAAGVDRVVTLDLHAGQIQGFFDIPVDNLKFLPIAAQYFRNKGLNDIVVVAPDVGGVARAREFSSRLNAPLAIIDKRRPAPNVSEVMHVVGDVSGKVCIMVDDIIDTAGTIVNGAEALLREGAARVFACATHAVFSDPAPERMQESPLEEVVVSDSIPLVMEKRFEKLRILSAAELFADAIRRIFEERSVSRLFD